MAMRKFGRLPVLFWSQVNVCRTIQYVLKLNPSKILGLGFLIGCTFSPNLPTFAGMCYLRRLSILLTMLIYNYLKLCAA